MALYDTRFGLPQSMVDYLNQGLPSIDQPLTVDLIDSQPIEDEDDQVLEQLYPQNVSSGGDGYSVYNPDPNMTRTFKNYNPRPAYEAAFGTMMGDPEANIATGALNTSGIMGPYQERPPSKIQELLSNTMLGRGIKGIGSFAKNLLSGLPPNRAGIFQNELLGGRFMLDNTGRIVTNDYNTPTGIMAGYNPVSGGLLNLVTGGEKGEPTTYGLDKSYDKRRETIAKALEKMGMSKEDIEAAIAGEYEGDAPINPITGMPTELVDRLGLINQSQNLINKRKDAADIIFNRKVEEKRQRDIQKAIDKEKSKPTAATFNPKTTSGGGGTYDSGREGGYTGARDSYGDKSGTRQRDARSSDLGFSDIRLKENIELIGKSPSNINIYKFNYKNNTTTYQGAMAHEVPWASVKHSNGYMMVDYNLLDVEFKKYNA